MLHNIVYKLREVAMREHRQEPELDRNAWVEDHRWQCIEAFNFGACKSHITSFSVQ